MRQIAALPYRIPPHGQAEAMRITSRETRRRVPSEGNRPAVQAEARKLFPA